MGDDASRANGASTDPSHPSGPVETDDASTSTDDRATDSDAAGETDARRVVVPTDVYKRVTVFSTLFAVVTVVAGFLLLDSATRRATLELSEVDPVLALAGLGCIVLGAVTYAFSTRFQAEGMGNAKEEPDETSDNG